MELGKLEAPTCEIIDLDEEYTVLEWNENVTKRLKEAVIADGERNLDSLMKWYLLALKDNVLINNLELLKISILKHLKFFKYYLMELNCLYVDNYLANMENILVHYFEIELKCAAKQQPNGKIFGKNMVRHIYNRVRKVLHTYLLAKEENAYHVLMKVKFEFTKEIVMLMNFVYGKFLTKEPTDRSDLAFCRAYLLFEKWKKIRLIKFNKQDVEMEIFFFKMWRRSAHSLKENPVLRKILYPNTSSILDTLALNSDDDHDNLVERYFDFISSGNIQEGEVIKDALESRNPQTCDVEVCEDSEEEGNEGDEEFVKAYDSYLRSMNPNTVIVDTIEIPDDEIDNDDDCKIVEEIVLFCDISDDDDCEIVSVSNQKNEFSKGSGNDKTPKESEVSEIIEHDSPGVLEEPKPERLESAIEQPNARLDAISESLTPTVTVVPSLSENPDKKLTSSETRTDFVNQIDGLPTPTGSEDRDNDDPMSFDVNKPLVYTPILSTPNLPTPVIDSNSDTDNSKNDVRPQSPSTSQNQERPAEETPNSPEEASQVSRDDTQVSTSESRSAIVEKSSTEPTVPHEKDMSPDSSEDAARSAKIMYTAPHKLKQMKDVPDYSSFMNENSSSDNPFVGQIDGRLNRTCMEEYSAIAENLNLYESQDDTLSDNNVSSSNNLTEPSGDCSPSENKADDKVIAPEIPKPKKKLTLCEEVTTTDDSKPRSPVLSATNFPLKSILKPKKLSVSLRTYSIEELQRLQKNNEISVKQANETTYPKFSFFMLKYDSEEGKSSNSEEMSPSSNRGKYTEWRDQNTRNSHAQQDSTRYASSRTEDNFNQEGMVTSNNNNNTTNEFCHQSSISNQCGNFCCCSGLAAGFCTLNISHSPKKKLNLSSISTYKSNSPILTYNPFLNERRKSKKRKHSPEPPKIYDFCSNVPIYDAVKTPDTMSPNINLDISFMSIVENFDKESTDFTLDLTPVTLEKDINHFDNKITVSELEEFDANKLNESIKTSSMPQDLYNLNLQNFSPSPINNCLSPRSNSPSHTFVQENNCAFTQQNEESNIDLKNQLIPAHLTSLEYSNTICNYDIKYCEPVNPTNSSNTHFNKNYIEKVNFDESECNLKVNNKTESKQFELTEEDNCTRISLKVGDVSASTDKEGTETRLPLKKRKLSVVNNKGEEVDDDDDYLGPDLVEEIIRRAREEEADKEDISYPAKPMISIAEIQDKLTEQTPRIFKTPAEKKEMPPPPLPSNPLPSDPLPSEPVASGSLNVPPKVVTEQYNNLTYNNPTIYYHMNNVPYTFFPCASLPYFPSFIVPMNSTTTIDMNVVPKHEQYQQQPPNQQPQNQQPTESQEPPAVVPPTRPKREKKSRGRKKHN